jgi:hypothetical protein
MTSDTGPTSHISIVAGRPTDAEIAALVAVLTAAAAAGARAASGSAQTPARRSEWAARPRLMRQPAAAGPGAWRRSAFPG